MHDVITPLQGCPIWMTSDRSMIICDGRSIKKLNGAILLIFTIRKIRNIGFVRNIIGHIY